MNPMLAQRTTNSWYGFQLFWWEIVEILVCWRAWVNLIRNAIEAGHEHSGESEIRICHWIREANLDTLCFRA